MKGMLNTDRKPVVRKIEKQRILYICPRCGEVLLIHGKYKKNLCMRCGQWLDWEKTASQWWVEWLVCQNREDAYRCAVKYKDITGIEWFEPERFLNREQNRNQYWPQNMCFPFMDSKAYGRFMRWVAKDGPTRLIF